MQNQINVTALPLPERVKLILCQVFAASIVMVFPYMACDYAVGHEILLCISLFCFWIGIIGLLLAAPILVEEEKRGPRR